MNYHDGCYDNGFYIWFITDTLCISQVLVGMATT